MMFLFFAASLPQKPKSPPQSSSESPSLPVDMPPKSKRVSLSARLADEIPFICWMFILAVLALRSLVPILFDEGWLPAATASDEAATQHHMPLAIITSSLVVAVSATAGKILLKT
jgi:hypothetical protein